MQAFPQIFSCWLHMKMSSFSGIMEADRVAVFVRRDGKRKLRSSGKKKWLVCWAPGGREKRGKAQKWFWAGSGRASSQPRAWAFSWRIKENPPSRFSAGTGFTFKKGSCGSGVKGGCKENRWQAKSLIRRLLKRSTGEVPRVWTQILGDEFEIC